MSASHVDVRWSTFDALKGMLAFIHEKRKTIPSRMPILHNALYKIWQKTDYNKFLKNYVFDKKGHFPFAREFQTDLMNLELSGHLSSVNPTFKDYSIQPKLNNTFNKYEKGLFSDDDFNMLKKMSEDFLNALDEANNT